MDKTDKDYTGGDINTLNETIDRLGDARTAIEEMTKYSDDLVSKNATVLYTMLDLAEGQANNLLEYIEALK